ncbi:MAG: hypothetical protein ABIJ86_12690 [Spirochaetota bacterium]
MINEDYKSLSSSSAFGLNFLQTPLRGDVFVLHIAFGSANT